MEQVQNDSKGEVTFMTVAVIKVSLSGAFVKKKELSNMPMVDQDLEVRG